MAYRTVRCEDRDGVVVLTLDRPDRLNAIDERLVEEVAEVVERCNADPDARALVLTGAGRAFCAGADVHTLDENIAREAEGSAWGSDQIRMKVRARFQQLTRTVFRAQVPTIAAVRGPAVGGGLDLVCACDLAIASDTARFMVAYTRRALFPDLGGYWLLPRLIGYRKAAELVFTGRFVEAEEALAIGLVNQVVADDALDAAVLDLARAVASGPPIALRLAKMLMQRCAHQELETALEMGAMGTVITETSDDFRESVAAFLDKRPPVYRGR